MCQRRNNKESKKYFEMNENKNTAYQNSRGTVKVLLRGKLTARIHEIRNSKTTEEISGTKSWFFEEVNNINKHELD